MAGLVRRGAAGGLLRQRRLLGPPSGRLPPRPGTQGSAAAESDLGAIALHALMTHPHVACSGALTLAAQPVRAPSYKLGSSTAG